MDSNSLPILIRQLIRLDLVGNRLLTLIKKPLELLIIIITILTIFLTRTTILLLMFSELLLELFITIESFFGFPVHIIANILILYLVNRLLHTWIAIITTLVPFVLTFLKHSYTLLHIAILLFTHILVTSFTTIHHILFACFSTLFAKIGLLLDAFISTVFQILFDEIHCIFQYSFFLLGVECKHDVIDTLLQLLIQLGETRLAVRFHFLFIYYRLS